MFPYAVTIYEKDIFEHEPENLLSSHYVSISLVSTVRVLARNERSAAARAYVAALGLERARIMIDLHAPAACIRAELNLRALVRWLRKTTNWKGEFWMLSNLVQTWYFQPEVMPSSDSAKARTMARRVCRRSRCAGCSRWLR